MNNAERPLGGLSRRSLIIWVGAFLVTPGTYARAVETKNLDDRFDYLSANSNSNCSTKFMDSIATMPAVARLQGSCCSPMDRHRYIEQIRALAKHSAIREIPPDPYDIAAGLAQKLMPYYDLTLSLEEQPIYQYAMDSSDEKGPCCCQCWRWKVYGGLAKYLIRERHFSGKQLVEVWNLSSGCGGGAEHHHG